MSTMVGTIREKVEYVYSPERNGEWIIFRESLQDRSLLDVPEDVYVMNMRAAYLELIGGTMMHALGGMAALHNRASEVMENYQCFSSAIEQQERAEQMVKLKDIYNKAFGSSRDGVRALVQEFNRRVAGGKMSARSQDVLHEHFMAASLPMLNAFRQADGGAGGTMRGTGCLLLLAGGLSIAFSSIYIMTQLGQ